MTHSSSKCPFIIVLFLVGWITHTSDKNPSPQLPTLPQNQEVSDMKLPPHALKARCH